MSDVVIRAEGLAKAYLIGHETGQARYTALRDVLALTAKSFARSTLSLARGRQLIVGDEIEEFWALKDVSFEIRRGEAVGIIGRNGAGKSTLLKILSRITEPTKGRVEIKGRLASLLEVGTGFHPELTGRENIYLNGAILGMKRAEIRHKFDEIVAFAEVEKFLDTPVKRYSSGMYVRLAFAVAAHLEPEILVVDEVLAVGDAEFQKKCLGKLHDVAGGGRTVLFVSHNMGAVQELSQRVIVLKKGEVIADANPINAIRIYSERPNNRQEKYCFSCSEFQVLEFELSDGEEEELTLNFRKDSNIAIRLIIELQTDQPFLHIGYALYSGSNRPLWWSFFGDMSGNVGLKAGCHELVTHIPPCFLNDGKYSIEIIAALHGFCWLLHPTNREVAMEFSVQGGALGSPLVSATTRPGFLMPVFNWEIRDDRTHSLRI